MGKMNEFFYLYVGGIVATLVIVFLNSLDKSKDYTPQLNDTYIIEKLFMVTERGVIKKCIQGKNVINRHMVACTNDRDPRWSDLLQLDIGDYFVSHPFLENPVSQMNNSPYIYSYSFSEKNLTSKP